MSHPPPLGWRRRALQSLRWGREGEWKERIEVKIGSGRELKFAGCAYREQERNELYAEFYVDLIRVHNREKESKKSSY